MSLINDDNFKLVNCACRNLRMTTRVITQYYDKALCNSGLKSTQFTLLVDIISHKSGTSVNELADYVMMDQTTVTRNVEILRKKGYVDVRIDDTDSRKKSITASEEGERRLAIAVPLWKEAQEKIQQAVGQNQYQVFLKTLSALREM